MSKNPGGKGKGLRRIQFFSMVTLKLPTLFSDRRSFPGDKNNFFSSHSFFGKRRREETNPASNPA